jgi:hypothetical protein
MFTFTTRLTAALTHLCAFFHTSSSAATASSLPTSTASTGGASATHAPRSSWPLPPAPIYLGLRVPIVRDHHLFNIHAYSQESLLPQYVPRQDPPPYPGHIEPSPSELSPARVPPLRRRWSASLFYFLPFVHPLTSRTFTGFEFPVVWLLGLPAWFHVHVVPDEGEADIMPDGGGRYGERRRCCLAVLFTILVAGGIGLAFVVPKMT